MLDKSKTHKRLYMKKLLAVSSVVCGVLFGAATMAQPFDYMPFGNNYSQGYYGGGPSGYPQQPYGQGYYPPYPQKNSNPWDSFFPFGDYFDNWGGRDDYRGPAPYPQQGPYQGQGGQNFNVAPNQGQQAPAPEKKKAKSKPAETVDLGTIIIIDNLQVDKPEVEVSVGKKVTWINQSKTPHILVAVDGNSETGELGYGDSITTAFYKPGVYEYYSKFYSTMKGKIIVEDGL